MITFTYTPFTITDSDEQDGRFEVKMGQHYLGAIYQSNPEKPLFSYSK